MLAVLPQLMSTKNFRGRMLRVAVPNKGSLSEASVGMLKEAGYRQRYDLRDLILQDLENDIEFYFLRPGDIPLYVASGVLDAGITGKDFAPRRANPPSRCWTSTSAIRSSVQPSSPTRPSRSIAHRARIGRRAPCPRERLCAPRDAASSRSSRRRRCSSSVRWAWGR